MPDHNLLFLDAETYYDTNYTLKTLTPVEYILDERFEEICWSGANWDAPVEVLHHKDFPEWLSQFDPAKTTTVTFNSLFDNCILAWHYGYVPARMVDVMGMARALYGHKLPSVSLANVAAFLGVGKKGTEIGSMAGVRAFSIDHNPPLRESFYKYCANDTEIMRRAFYKLWPEFPSTERLVLDRVLRCAVEPRFMIDREMLQAHYEEVLLTKETMMRQAAASVEGGVLDLRTLRSDAKFRALLERLGVEVETKISPTGKEIPAFAKTDQFMADLQEDPDPTIQALAAARLGLRSTLEEKRSQRLLAISALPWERYRNGNPRLYSGGTMPIPLRFSGGHTHRLSGDWKINMQNLPSGRGTTKGSKLRKALIAPPGHDVVKIDLSQIEARVAAWLCGQEDLLGQFARKKDPYGLLGMKVFGLTAEELAARGGKESLERFVGKSGVLGLGFGCGAPKFYNMVLRSARGMGMNITGLKQVFTPEVAQKTVDTYRGMNAKIVSTWKLLDHILNTCWNGSASYKFGPVIISHGQVMLPNGMPMRYDVLGRNAENDLMYRYGKRILKMYGSKFLENIVQALARVIIMNAAMRLWDRGFEFKLQEHDALAFLVPTEKVTAAIPIILEEVTRAPSWAPTLPLAADISYGKSYGG